MTAIIQFFTSHFFGNMVYGIINNLITFIFVWFIHAFIPYKPKYQSRKNLTRATLLLYIGLLFCGAGTAFSVFSVSFPSPKP